MLYKINTHYNTCAHIYIHTCVQDIRTSHVRHNNTVRQCDNVLVMSIMHSSLMDGGNKQEERGRETGDRERVKRRGCVYQPVTMITTMSGMVCLACDMLAQGGSCSRHLFFLVFEGGDGLS